ncbi:MAG: FIST C-terminal domain-containing protein [Spirochaetales bacterium]|nr:FIST C-terminal domain-containing protein [Spirochaetales bacterium]
MSVSIFESQNAADLASRLLARKDDAGLALIFFGAEFDYKALFAGLNGSALPFIGCMDTGRLCNDNYNLTETHATAMVLPRSMIEALEIFTYDMRPELGYTAIREASANLFRNALNKLNINEKDPDLSRVFAINLVFGLMSANPVLEGQNRVSLFFQTVGGSSGGKLDFKAAPVISSRGMGPLGATAVVRLARGYSYVTGLTSSFEKTEHKLKVTRLAGPRHILEFNGQPAAAEYARILGLSPGDLSPNTYATYTLGLDTGDGERLITSIQQGDNQGGLLTYNDVNADITFTVYRATSQLEPRKSRLSELSSQKVAAFLSFDCVLCYLARNQQQEIQTIASNYAAILPGVPKIGFGTFSENYCGANVNQTETFLAILED